MTQSARAFLCDTVTSPFATVTSQRALGRPFVTSKRIVPVAFSSSGSWPRVPSSWKNAVVASISGLLSTHFIEQPQVRHDIIRTA